MFGKCAFAPDINNCPHYIANKEGCVNPKRGCSFFREFDQIKESTESTYVKEPKWFERYYK